jgi:D-glycero-D-manno-heptose 1,7-bisphosphate phosphatase
MPDNKAVTQAVILAGGLGTRLKPFTDTNPKPMFPIGGIPFIDYLVRQLRAFGMEEALVLLGYLPEKISGYLGNGARYGLRVRYDATPTEYDTGARLLHAAPLLAERFLLLYCDNYCPVRYPRLLADFMENSAAVQFSAYRNRDGYTKSNLRIAENGLVEAYDKTRAAPGLNGVDIGYALVDKTVLSLLTEESGNFEAQVYPQLAARGMLFATVTEHRYYSVGSYGRIRLTEEFFRPRRVVFLDRDGTLNRRAPRARYIERPEDFVWLPGAVEAVRAFKDSGFLVFIITNQPGIARGNLSEETLRAIHSKMQAELAGAGAGIDDIFFCPHNWDDGCFCRNFRRLVKRFNGYG